MSSAEGKFSNNGMWKLKKRVCPKNIKEKVSAKKDENGTLETNPFKIKKLYLKVYQHRLRHRKIKPELEKLQKLRLNVFKIRLKLAKEKKSKEWSMKELDKVINNLKKDKSPDSAGLVNEVVKNMGKDLKESLLILLNRIKTEHINPNFMDEANIISIYKGKGEKSCLDNERGVFILNIFRMIKDKLIYNDIYGEVDKNMSESQAGGRKNRSFREHLFVLHSVINSVIQKESPNIDVTMYDLEKCFDSLNLIECCNDMCEVGVTDDKLTAIYEGNRKNDVAINTPCGQTDRVEILDILTQGASLPPLICGVQVDQIGKKALEEKKYNLFHYKSKIPITMLSMIDDLLSISECGIKSVENNSFINAQFEMKCLKLNQEKCHNIHVGKEVKNCVKLKAHDDILLNVDSDKYVGDIISKDGLNTKNIKARIGRGIGAIGNIMNILKQVSLGNFHFEIALLLRQTIFLSSILLNAETWVNLTKTDIEELEKLDESLLRRLLGAPSKSPIPGLYLELGVYQIRYHIIEKRLMFLHHILSRDENRLISKVFWAQEQNPAKNDWVLQVKDDLKLFGLEYVTFEQIKQMKKEQFRSLIKLKCKKVSFKALLVEKQKRAKSKMKCIEYTSLEIQEYLTSNEINLRRKTILFKLRMRMISTPENFGIKTLCKICQIEEDTTEHLLNCIFLKLKVPEILNNMDVAIKDAFQSNIPKMNACVQLFEKAWRMREQFGDI